MPTFKDIAKYVSKYDINKSFTKVFSAKSVQTWMLETIKRRLYNQGITGSELKLRTDKGNPFYTDAYVRVKKKKGERVSNVTLYLEGGFYSSFKVLLIKNGWRIEADWGYTAVHFKDLYATEEEFHQDVMSLTNSELDFIMRNFIRADVASDFHETIYRP